MFGKGYHYTNTGERVTTMTTTTPERRLENNHSTAMRTSRAKTANVRHGQWRRELIYSDSSSRESSDACHPTHDDSVTHRQGERNDRATTIKLEHRDDFQESSSKGSYFVMPRHINLVFISYRAERRLMDQAVMRWCTLINAPRANTSAEHE